MELHEMTARQLGELLVSGRVSAAEVTRTYLERITSFDAGLGAYLQVTADEALRQAEEVDRKRQAGEALSPLAGIPVALNDNFCVDGVETTCASKMLRGYVPPYEATAAARLKASGMPLLGKTNIDEFGLGASTETSDFGATRNPWDPERVPGGASGGAAAAVAAGLAPWAVGSDTGGSLRLPAAFCGVVGLRPTYGRVSRFGIVANASSLDQAGPVARTVEDAAILLQAIAGHDPLDVTTSDQPVPDVTEVLRDDVSGLRIGLPSSYFGEGVDGEVKASVEAAVRRLEEAGARIVEVAMPHTEAALWAFHIISAAEASSNLARYDGVRFGHRSADAPDVATMFRNTRSEGFGPEVKRRILLGTYVLSAGNYDVYFEKAQRVRTLVARDFEQAFRECDVLATPTVPSVAFRLQEMVDDPVRMYAYEIFTAPASLAGVPAISLPCGVNGEGLPIGIQLIAKPWDEALLLQAAYALEQRRGTLPARPQLEVESNG